MFKPKEYKWDQEIYNISYYLRDLLSSGENMDNVDLLHKEYDAHILFYINLLKENKQNIRLIKTDDLKEGQIVIAHQTEVIDKIENNYEYVILEKKQNIVKYKITHKKESDE